MIFRLFSGAFFRTFLLRKTLSVFCLCLLCVGAVITNFMPVSDGLYPYPFPSKDGKDAVYERRSGRRGVCLTPELAFFLGR